MEELKKAPVTVLLILANILVFTAVEFTGGSEDTMHMLQCGAAYTPAIMQGEYYRIFTSMFLHFGPQHLGNKMLVLFVLCLLYTSCYEMESGVSESEAYRRFGERCGQAKYKTFATLLIQNLQKGSRQMADMLERESTEAWEERKRKARVLGEAAATKLLVPMIMMLIVVMAIVMIPA